MPCRSSARVRCAVSVDPDGDDRGPECAHRGQLLRGGFRLRNPVEVDDHELRGRFAGQGPNCGIQPSPLHPGLTPRESRAQRTLGLGVSREPSRVQSFGRRCHRRTGGRRPCGRRCRGSAAGRRSGGLGGFRQLADLILDPPPIGIRCAAVRRGRPSSLGGAQLRQRFAVRCGKSAARSLRDARLLHQRGRRRVRPASEPGELLRPVVADRVPRLCTDPVRRSAQRLEEFVLQGQRAPASGAERREQYHRCNAYSVSGGMKVRHGTLSKRQCS